MQGFPADASGREPACQCRRCKRYRFNFWIGKIPRGRTQERGKQGFSCTPKVWSEFRAGCRSSWLSVYLVHL